jgi:hypothetical protein
MKFEERRYRFLPEIALPAGDQRIGFVDKQNAV